MKKLYPLLFLVVLLFEAGNAFAQNTAPQLVTADATAEAKALYAYTTAYRANKLWRGSIQFRCLAGRG